MAKKKTNVPKTKVNKEEGKIVKKKVEFKKSQRRLLNELTIKHTREINEVINEILEEEGLKGEVMSSVKTELMPRYEGVIIYIKEGEKEKDEENSKS